VDLRTVSGRAGHADGHMTLGTYAHFQQAQDRQAAEFIDELLARIHEQRMCGADRCPRDAQGVGRVGGCAYGAPEPGVIAL
jgi:hypothetical protein